MSAAEPMMGRRILVDASGRQPRLTSVRKSRIVDTGSPQSLGEVIRLQTARDLPFPGDRRGLRFDLAQRLLASNAGIDQVEDVGKRIRRWDRDAGQERIQNHLGSTT